MRSIPLFHRREAMHRCRFAFPANRPEAGTEISIHIAGREPIVPGPRGNPLLKILFW
jgi:hypothetical protein